MLGGIGGKRRRGSQRTRRLDGITDSMDMSLSELQEWWTGWWTGRPGVLRFMGSQRVGHDWATDLIWSDNKSMQRSVEEWKGRIGVTHCFFITFSFLKAFSGGLWEGKQVKLNLLLYSIVQSASSNLSQSITCWPKAAGQSISHSNSLRRIKKPHFLWQQKISEPCRCPSSSLR